MKRLFLAALLAAFVPAAARAATGYLVHWETGQSVTGRFIYICVYEVLGEQQTVNLTRMCPMTMEFQ